jgi:glycosyltransferase involved in cell wall biosynthesis
MTTGVCKVLILAGRLQWHDGAWPVVPLIDRLALRGVHVQVLCASRGEDLTADPRAVERPALANRWLRSIAVRRLWSDGRLERPDIMHVVHDAMADVGLAVSEHADLPYLQTVSRFDTVAHGLRLSRRWCRGLVATGPDLAQELIEDLGVPRERVAVIPPGMAANPAPRRSASSASVPVIGTGGLLDEDSGMMTFLEAARRVLDAGRDVEFVIASQGSEQVVLRHRIQQLKIADRVTVADYRSVGAEFWTVLDIYCQPALNASTGRTLIQALGHALPCIATNVRGLRTLINAGDNGVIVPPADPVALKNAVVALLDHPEEARRLGSNALERARTQFDPDIEAARLAEVYRQASGSSASPKPALL